MSLGSQDKETLEQIRKSIAAIQTTLAVISSNQQTIVNDLSDTKAQVRDVDKRATVMETNFQNLSTAITQTVENAILKHYQNRSDIQQEVSLTRIGLMTGGIALAVSLVFGVLNLFT